MGKAPFQHTYDAKVLHHVSSLLLHFNKVVAFLEKQNKTNNKRMEK